MSANKRIPRSRARSAKDLANTEKAPQAHVTAKFYDNSQLSADVLRTCTSKP